MNSIRCLGWEPFENKILIGSIDGKLYSWGYDNYGIDPLIIANLG